MTAVRTITTDDFLGGALRLCQPAKGVRAGADSVLLAAAVEAGAGADVLDVGTGTGVVALSLAHRLPQISVDGLEIQPDLAALARDNVALNDLDGRVRIVDGDLGHPPTTIAPNSYDVVVSNPPYFAAGQAMASPEASRAAARTEGAMDVAAWLRACLKMLKPRGQLYLVFRADRLDVLLSALQGRAGDIMVYPLWPKTGQPAKTIIVKARKGGRGPLVLHPGFVLHDDAGAYTAAAEAVLRGGAPLPM